MKFTINPKLLAFNLKKVAGAVSREQPRLVLSVNEDGMLAIRAANHLAEAHVKRVETIVTKSIGTVGVEAKRLNDLVGSFLSKDEIEFTTSEKQVTIKSGKSRYRLTAFNPKEIPVSLNLPTDGDSFVIDAGELSGMIDALSPVVPTQDVRYYLNGICFDNLNGDGLRAIGTDGHRMHIYTPELISGQAVKFCSIVPVKLIPLIKTLISNYHGQIKATFGQTYCQFETACGEALKGQLIEGNFADYRRVLPQDKMSNVFVDKDTAIEAIARASLLTGERRAVVMEGKGTDLQFTPECHNKTDEGVEFIEDVVVTGDPVPSIALNSHYLSQAISCVGDEVTVLQYKDSNSQVVVSGPSSKTIAIVMPLRL